MVPHSDYGDVSKETKCDYEVIQSVSYRLFSFFQLQLDCEGPGDVVNTNVIIIVSLNLVDVLKRYELPSILSVICLLKDFNKYYPILKVKATYFVWVKIILPAQGGAEGGVKNSNSKFKSHLIKLG